MLGQSFDITLPDMVSREKIIAAIAVRMEQLIAGNPDQLFSMLYRLDISEKRIKEAMASNEAIAHQLAILIYERQLEKIAARQRFKSRKPDDDLAW